MPLSSKRNAAITTPISSLIERELQRMDMSWNQLVKMCNFQPNFATRVRRQGVIPNPKQLDNIAVALRMDWKKLWVTSGYLTEEKAKSLGTSEKLLSIFQLNEDEAMLVDAYRCTHPSGRDYLLSAVKGNARASDHIRANTTTKYKRRVIIDLDFHNDPSWLLSSYGSDLEDHEKYLSYSGQAAIVGILRYCTTGKQSPLSRALSETLDYDELQTYATYYEKQPIQSDSDTTLSKEGNSNG